MYHTIIVTKSKLELVALQACLETNYLIGFKQHNSDFIHSNIIPSFTTF